MCAGKIIDNSGKKLTRCGKQLKRTKRASRRAFGNMIVWEISICSGDCHRVLAWILGKVVSCCNSNAARLGGKSVYVLCFDFYWNPKQVFSAHCLSSGFIRFPSCVLQELGRTERQEEAQQIGHHVRPVDRNGAIILQELH